MSYWISQEEFDKCDNVLYRAFVYNLQEDLWNRAYRARELGECTPVSQQLFNLLRANKAMFNAYIKAPTSQKITNHLNLIDLRLRQMKSLLESLQNVVSFSGFAFLEAVNILLDEFGK